MQASQTKFFRASSAIHANHSVIYCWLLLMEVHVVLYRTYHYNQTLV